MIITQATLQDMDGVFAILKANQLLHFYYLLLYELVFFHKLP